MAIEYDEDGGISGNRSKESIHSAQSNSDSSTNLSTKELTKAVIKDITKEHAEHIEEAKSRAVTIQVTNLPSDFKIYPKNTSISFKTYTYRDLSELSIESLPLLDRYKIVLKGIKTEGINNLNITSNDISFQDFLYISVLRRLTSMKSNKFSMPYYCPKCSTSDSSEYIHHFELSDLGFSSLDVPMLPINIDFYSIDKLSFKPLSIGSLIFLLETNKLYIKDDKGNFRFDENNIKIKDEVAIYASMVVDKDFEESYELISSISDERDIEILETIDEMLNHTLEPLEFTCKNNIQTNDSTEENPKSTRCGQRLKINLLDPEVIIFPFRETRDDFKARISFGV